MDPAPVLVVPSPPPGQTACREALAKVFPPEYLAEAIITLHFENGKETPDRVGVNSDKARSKDHGCLQINDYWHYGRPGSAWKKGEHDRIYEPEYNARVAWRIFERNGKTWKPWYGPCTKGKEKLPLDRCGR